MSNAECISSDRDPNFDTVVGEGVQQFRGSPEETKTWLEQHENPEKRTWAIWVGSRQTYTYYNKYVTQN